MQMQSCVIRKYIFAVSAVQHILFVFQDKIPIRKAESSGIKSGTQKITFDVQLESFDCSNRLLVLRSSRALPGSIHIFLLCDLTTPRAMTGALASSGLGNWLAAACSYLSFPA